MQRGSIVSIVLVFGLAFLIMLGGLFTFILVQYRQGVEMIAWEQALQAGDIVSVFPAMGGG